MSSIIIPTTLATYIVQFLESNHVTSLKLGLPDHLREGLDTATTDLREIVIGQVDPIQNTRQKQHNPARTDTGMGPILDVDQSDFI